jgi:hypothetical protein
VTLSHLNPRPINVFAGDKNLFKNELLFQFQDFPDKFLPGFIDFTRLRSFSTSNMLEFEINVVKLCRYRFSANSNSSKYVY